MLDAIAAANIHSPLPGEALDIGSGNGELVGAIRARFGLRTSACDYTDALMKDPTQRVEIVDLNADKLPYLDGRFCLVTCIGTIEYLEQTRPLLREIFRVLEPGGAAVISTPNILNLPSRLRYLMTGFFSRFHPLSIRERCHPGGRINPVNYFYLAHALFFWLREKNKFRTIAPANRDLVAAVNSRDLLLGRTLIVCARKPM